jgi:hypothetical protein
MFLRDLVRDLAPYYVIARDNVGNAEGDVLAQLAPVRNVPNTRLSLRRIMRLDQTAPVRAMGAPSTPIRTSRLIKIDGDLPEITPRAEYDEDELLDFVPVGQLDPDLERLVFDGTGQVSATIRNTLTLMRGALFSTGELTFMQADGQVAGATFGVPAPIAITTAWNQIGNTALDDFEAGVDQARAQGFRPGIFLTSNEVRRALRVSLQARFPNAPIGDSGLRGYLADNNLPEVVTVDGELVEQGDTPAEDVRRRIYPVDRGTFLPALGDPVARTVLGVTLDARRAVQNGVIPAANAPGVSIATLASDDPPKVAVRGSARGAPVVEDPRRMLILSGLIT